MKLVRTCIVLLGAVSLGAQDRFGVIECGFTKDPVEFLTRESRIRRGVHEQVLEFSARASAPGKRRTADAVEIPRRNFIDEAIFNKLAARGVPSARLSTDEEFFRRIHLDLIGRLPSPDEIRAFLADEAANKRDIVIDRLLYSAEFIERWAVWLGDLLQNVSFPAAFDRQLNGTVAYQYWIRVAIAEKSLRDMAVELITASGNHFDLRTAAANYPISAKTPMGPIQDTYDTALARTATTFLGVSAYDCLLCHSGRGHLEQVNLWGSEVTRTEVQRMAAFFSRLNMPQRNLATTDFYYRSFDVSDRATGGYDLNTNFGNRPDRVALGATRSLTPEYRGTGAAPRDGNWRAAFADSLVNDPMFARNFANRLWKEMFSLALVEPVDGLDPARLDPANPPPEPWMLQATHPDLLERLAGELRERQYSLREFLRLLVESNAYQLSSRYDGQWKYDYVALFARHYPRRMWAEEVHDAIIKSTGVTASYAMRGWPEPTTWAMQLPEPAEPRGNGAVATFLNLFLRGNRDSMPRSQSGSILQQMYLMNDTLVTNRIRMTASPALQAVSRLTENDAVIDQMFLLFLSRRPTEAERQAGVKFLAGATTAAERNAFIEDLAWVCINKADFLFSY